MTTNTNLIFKFLSGKGLYVVLLPVFFVIHGYVENFGLVSFQDCLPLLATYLVATLFMYLLIRLIYKNPRKASLLTTYLFFLFFFFGAIDDFFKDHLFYLSKYSFILPAYFLTTVLLLIYLYKSKNKFDRLFFFLNLLLLIFISVDVINICWKSLHPNPDKLSIYGENKLSNFKACDDCKNPDIYFLLFDEYASTISLGQSFNYNNSALDSFLNKNGFFIAPYSQSNYNFTPFSMASILNMNYIKGIKNPDACTIQDYVNCNNLIRNNTVDRFLSSRNYDVVNYSIFDLAGNPSLFASSLLPVKTRLISDQTLFSRVIRDLGWNLYTGKFEIKWLTKDLIYGPLHNNNTIQLRLETESRLRADHPRFIYAHFEMPHAPFYFDKDFHARDIKTLLAEKKYTNVESYKGYLPYTNRAIEQLVDTIQKNTNRNAVIIVMGDHGFRVQLGNLSQSHQFKNLNAIYFPGKDYRLLKNNLSGVNQFRVIFNTLFNQQFPLLADSSIFLKDQP